MQLSTFISIISMCCENLHTLLQSMNFVGKWALSWALLVFFTNERQLSAAHFFAERINDLTTTCKKKHKK